MVDDGIHIDGVGNGTYTGYRRTRKDSGEGCWRLVRRNGIGGGGEEFAEEIRESIARREQAATVPSSSSLHPNLSSSSHVAFNYSSSPLGVAA